MIHDPETLATALGAYLERQVDSSSDYNREIFRFNDNRLKYELHLLPNLGCAQLAIDPEQPIQGCPMLEFSFKCSNIEIGASSYCTDGKEIAIRFYDGEITASGMRLTITWIPVGYWYIWANADNTPYPASDR